MSFFDKEDRIELDDRLIYRRHHSDGTFTMYEDKEYRDYHNRSYAPRYVKPLKPTMRIAIIAGILGLVLFFVSLYLLSLGLCLIPLILMVPSYTNIVFSYATYAQVTEEKKQKTVTEEGKQKTVTEEDKQKAIKANRVRNIICYALILVYVIIYIWGVFGAHK